jgi:hypothetical protein
MIMERVVKVRKRKIKKKKITKMKRESSSMKSRKNVTNTKLKKSACFTMRNSFKDSLDL